MKNLEGEGICLFGQQIRSKLKGYKLSVKDFRRNLQLKTKNHFFKNKKFTPSSTQTPRQSSQNKMRSQSAAFSHQFSSLSNSQYNLFSFDKRVKTVAEEYHPQFFSSIDLFERQMTHQRRMDQYLNVVFKKVQQDQDKLMKKLEKRIQMSEDDLKRSISTPHSNFIKRFKMQTLKVRTKKEKDDVQLNQQKRLNWKGIAAQEIFEKIRKTQHFPTPAKPMKVNKKLMQSEILSRVINNPKGFFESLQKQIKIVREKSKSKLK